MDHISGQNSGFGRFEGDLVDQDTLDPIGDPVLLPQLDRQRDDLEPQPMALDELLVSGALRPPIPLSPGLRTVASLCIAAS